MKKVCLVMTMLCALLLACKPEAEKPTVVTASVEDVTETTAKVVGQVTADGGADVVVQRADLSGHHESGSGGDHLF